MNYYVAYHFMINNDNEYTSGFGSSPLQNIEFNPFTISGVAKIGKIISDYVYKGKASVVIMNIIRLEK